MKFSKYLHMAAIGTLVMGMGYITAVEAAPTATVNVTLRTVGALTATVVDPMAFGKWNINSTAGSIQLVKATTGGVTASGATGGATAVALATNATPAQVTVAIDGGADPDEDATVVQLERTAVVDFAGGILALSDITYRTATEVGENVLAVTPATEDVTIVDGATAEPVFFGGTITATGTVASGDNAASFDVTFSY